MLNLLVYSETQLKEPIEIYHNNTSEMYQKYNSCMTTAKLSLKKKMTLMKFYHGYEKLRCIRAYRVSNPACQVLHGYE